MSGYKLHWFRISFICNSTTSGNEPCGKLTGGSYWFSCLPLINILMHQYDWDEIWINPELRVSAKWQIKSWTRPLQSSLFSSVTALFQFLLCWLEWQPFPHWTRDQNVQLCEQDPVRTTSGVLGSAAALGSCIADPGVSLHNATSIFGSMTTEMEFYLIRMHLWKVYWLMLNTHLLVKDY